MEFILTETFPTPFEHVGFTLPIEDDFLKLKGEDKDNALKNFFEYLQSKTDEGLVPFLEMDKMYYNAYSKVKKRQNFYYITFWFKIKNNLKIAKKRIEEAKQVKKSQLL